MPPFAITKRGLDAARIRWTTSTTAVRTARDSASGRLGALGAGFDWLIPGMRHELLIALIKSLPKQWRAVPAPAPNHYVDALLYSFRRSRGHYWMQLNVS